MNIIENLEKLCSLCGVSGWEDPVREEILRQLKGTCDVRVDALGNVIAHKKGAATPKNKLLLSAHMDEVGFIITYIEDSGLLRFTNVGGIDSRVVVGKAVEIGDARIYGVVGTKAVHLQEEAERSEPLKLDKLTIDIGARDKADALAVVRPGDRAVFSAPFGRMGDGRLYGRALDDRAGCAILLELLGRDLPWDCFFSFTVQEEIGCVGADTVGYELNPDIAIAVEATTASDIAGVDPDKVVCSQGAGPVISFMDRGAVYDRALYTLALETAKRHGIPCQCKAGVFGGNESRSFQTAGSGARILAVSLPCRYIHSPTNLLAEADIHHTAALLEKLIDAAAQA